MTYHRDTGRPDGSVATVTVRNLPGTPVTGWTLDQDRPTDGRSVSSGWNAAFTRTGRHVRVTAAEGAGALAADSASTASFGFVGADDGPNPDPTVFRLDGPLYSGS